MRPLPIAAACGHAACLAAAEPTKDFKTCNAEPKAGWEETKAKLLASRGKKK